MSASFIAGYIVGTMVLAIVRLALDYWMKYCGYELRRAKP